MKAAVVTKYGPPEVFRIEEVEKPVPKDHEIRIKIHATTASSGDCRIRKADPFAIRLAFGFTRPKTSILGNELAGVVESVGKQVTLFKEGDEVFGGTGFDLGANAEFVCLPEDGALAIKPDNLTFEEAAAIPFGATASLFFLRDKGKIRPGQKVLINGASGSLGTAAVQLAKYFGAEVTGVCSGANAALVKSLGADKVIDYTREDFTQNGETYDIIYDTIGKTSFSRSKDSLNPNGIFLAAVAWLPDYLRMLWTSMWGGRKLIAGVVSESRKNLIFLKELIEEEKIRPVIDRRYPLEQISEAHQYVEKGHKKGNVVITLN